MRPRLQKLLANLFVIPSQELKEQTKNLRLFLVWILSFFTLIRAFALLQFLADLDYSEISPVHLSRFIFVRVAILSFLVFLIYWIWQKPRRILFQLLMVLSFFTLWDNTDYISVFSASLVFAVSLRIYVSLFNNPLDNSTH